MNNLQKNIDQMDVLIQLVEAMQPDWTFTEVMAWVNKKQHELAHLKLNGFKERNNGRPV